MKLSLPGNFDEMNFDALLKLIFVVFLRSKIAVSTESTVKFSMKVKIDETDLEI